MINKVITLNDIDGNLTEVHIDDVLRNAGTLTTFSQKPHFLDPLTKIIPVDDSSNVFALNGVILNKDIDYSVVNEMNIELVDYPFPNSILNELKGSFKTQAQLKLILTDYISDSTTITVEDSTHLFLIQYNGIDEWLMEPQDYSIIDKTTIELINPPSQDFQIGEFFGGGANGLDGYTPVKGLDYNDGLSFNWKGEWQENVDYTKQDVVRDNADTYILIAENSNSTLSPSINADFELLIKGSDLNFIYGDKFPNYDSSNLGSIFQHADGKLYLFSTMDGLNLFWRQIG